MTRIGMSSLTKMIVNLSPTPIWTDRKTYHSQWLSDDSIALPGDGWYSLDYISTNDGAPNAHINIAFYQRNIYNRNIKNVACIPLPRSDDDSPNYNPINHYNPSPIYFEVNYITKFLGWEVRENSAMRGHVIVYRWSDKI